MTSPTPGALTQWLSARYLTLRGGEGPSVAPPETVIIPEVIEALRWIEALPVREEFEDAFRDTLWAELWERSSVRTLPPTPTLLALARAHGGQPFALWPRVGQKFHQINTWHQAYEQAAHQADLQANLARTMPETLWRHACELALQNNYPCPAAVLLAQWPAGELSDGENLLTRVIIHPDPTVLPALASKRPGPLGRHWVGAIELMRLRQSRSVCQQVLPQVLPLALARLSGLSAANAQKILTASMLEDWIQATDWPEQAAHGPLPQALDGALAIWGEDHLPQTRALRRAWSRQQQLQQHLASPPRPRRRT